MVQYTLINSRHQKQDLLHNDDDIAQKIPHIIL